MKIKYLFSFKKEISRKEERFPGMSYSFGLQIEQVSPKLHGCSCLSTDHDN